MTPHRGGRPRAASRRRAARAGPPSWAAAPAAAVLVCLSAGCGRAPGAGLESLVPPPASPTRSRANPPVVDPSAGRPVTLPELLAYAEVRAPSLLVANHRQRLGDAEVEGAQVLVPYNPSVAVTAGGRTAGNVSRFEFAAELQQRLEVAGERAARIAAAERSRDARGAEREVARWELHVTVHALYYKLLLRTRQLAAAAKLEGFTKSLRAIIDKRVAAGEDSPVQNIVVRAELARAAQTVITAKQAHRETALRLAAVAGWPASTELEVSGTLRPAKPVPNGSALARRALREHPSRRWLAAEVRSAEARIAREDLEAMPEPSIGVRYAREAEPGATAHVWTGTLRMPIPIWQRNQRRRARARAELGVAKANEAAFERALEARIGAAITRVNGAAERAAVFGEELLPAFASNLDKLERAFELGEIDVLQLAQVQQRILVTQGAALRALEDYYDALAALEGLTGVDLMRRETTR